MIQTPKEPKLAPLFASAIKGICSSPEATLNYPKQDVPLTVRLIVGKDGFEVTDEHNTVRCEFSKGAVFWYKMEKRAENIRDLNGRIIVINECTPFSVLEGKDVTLILHVFAFTVLGEEEAKGHKSSPMKSLNDISKDPEITPNMEVLKNVHLRSAIGKMQNFSNLSQLEDIMNGTKTAVANTVITGVEDEKKKKAKSEDEDVIVSFKDIDMVEKSISGDVEILHKAESELKGIVAAGSEGDIQRKHAIEKCAPGLKDPALVELLKNRGLLDRKRTPSKVSPKKRGNMPDELKSAVEALMSGKVEEGSAEKKLLVRAAKSSGKRTKAEGKINGGPQSEKKAAVEEDGNKVAKNKHSPKAPKKK